MFEGGAYLSRPLGVLIEKNYFFAAENACLDILNILEHVFRPHSWSLFEFVQGRVDLLLVEL